MIKRQDLSGQRFGKLTVLEFAFTRKKHSYWRCICDCGNETVVECSSLKSGKSTSCGCNCITHHESTTRLYKIYRKMRERTEYNKSNRWKNYGGRGIKVCDDWCNSYEAFRDWAVYNGYNDTLTLDRADVNGNYEPSNCRWVTPKEQARNTSVNVKFDGKSLTEWAEITGISHKLLWARINKLGWSVEKALSTPTRPMKRKQNG